MAEKFDAIIIGTGQAGPSLAQRMTREGMKVAILTLNLRPQQRMGALDRHVGAGTPGRLVPTV